MFVGIKKMEKKKKKKKKDEWSNYQHEPSIKKSSGFSICWNSNQSDSYCQDYLACWMGNRFSQPLTQSLVKVLEIFQETLPFTYQR